MKTDRARSTDVPGHGLEPDREHTSQPQMPSELDQLIERAGARFAVDLESFTRELPRSTKPVAPPEEPAVPQSPPRTGRRDVASALRPYAPRTSTESRGPESGDPATVEAPQSAVPVTASRPHQTALSGWIGGLPLVWIGAGVAATIALAGGFVALKTMAQPAAAVEADASRPAAATAAPPAAAAAQPIATVGRAVESPRTAAEQIAAPSTAGQPASRPIGAVTSSAPAQAQIAAPPTPGRRILLDQRFTGQPVGWPNSPAGTAWPADGVYRLFARQPGQFVAIDAPQTAPTGDVKVSATFRKVGGPIGGGYGIIVRGQNPGTRDGIFQGGRYYVLEAGDRGEVGAWRREDDRWVDLLPWTPSPAVRTGTATNELVVEARGPRLTFGVNGVEAVSVSDPTLGAGSVGIFVGGDLNEVALERFVVEAVD